MISMTLKQRTIAGRKIKLAEGIRYVASRRWATRGCEIFSVQISVFGQDTAVATVPGLTYDEANEFINKFNTDSFTGRRW